ncbi:hypothetical protein [Luteimonas chenhongjianii]|uniref:hypothetical protein n=1 Tax=Luteimonas chenhongjianii TaxID=2006110 RepID=UPI0012FDC000|nr:hypothetical protein [Luteimonas chenhongjianii]
MTDDLYAEALGGSHHPRRGGSIEATGSRYSEGDWLGSEVQAEQTRTMIANHREMARALKAKHGRSGNRRQRLFCRGIEVAAVAPCRGACKNSGSP